MQRRLKTRDTYAPEEAQVYGVLHEYADEDPDNPDLRYFVPTRVLFEAYYRWYMQFEWRWADAPQLLNEKQFGSALVSVFPELRDYGRRVRRDYHGRREWGYLGLKGPASIVSHGRRGRPRKSRTGAC